MTTNRKKTDKRTAVCEECGATYLINIDGCTRCLITKASAEKRARARQALGLDEPRDPQGVEDLFGALGLRVPPEWSGR